jgi:hypothetical protein
MKEPVPAMDATELLGTVHLRIVKEGIGKGGQDRRNGLWPVIR